MRPVDPVTVTDINGAEHKCLLTMGGLRRVMQRLGVRSVQELMEQHAESAIVTILYEALPAQERTAMTEEQFAELLPADINTLAAAVASLLGAQPKRPQVADGQGQPS